MEFDNNKTLYNAMRTELFATVIFGSLVPLSFLGIYQNKFIELADYQYALIIVLVYSVVAYFWYGLQPHYISINTNGNDILIKYFRILPKFIKPKPKMVKIPKTTYVKYKIETSSFGMKKALYLFQRTKKGVVKYPAIYISSLKEDEIDKLMIALKF